MSLAGADEFPSVAFSTKSQMGPKIAEDYDQDRINMSQQVQRQCSHTGGDIWSIVDMESPKLSFCLSFKPPRKAI